MKKRLLSLLLVLTMVISLLPTAAITAWADENGPVTLLVDAENGDDGVVYKNEATFKTITGALEKAHKGDTIQLTSDVTETVNVAEGKEVILDLNGQILTAGNEAVAIPWGGENVDAGLAIYNFGKLTISDTSSEKTGKICSTFPTGFAICIDNEAELSVLGGSIESGTAMVSIALLNSGTAVIMGENTGIGTDNQSEAPEYSSAVAIYNNGSDSELEIAGGTIYAGGNVSFSVTIFNELGEMTIGGESTVVSSLNTVTEGESYTVYGYGGTCRIGAGTFSGDIASLDGAMLSITDGKFSGTLESVKGAVSVFGGLFSSQDVRGYLADGAEAVTNTDPDTQTAYPWKVQPPKPAAKINWGGDTGEKEYYSVSLAVAACEGNAKSSAEKATTITMLRDTKDSVVIPKGKNIGLDLNGFTLTAGEAPMQVSIAEGEIPVCLAIYNLGKLTITDTGTSREKEGKIRSAYPEGEAFCIYNGAELSVLGGSVEGGNAQLSVGLFNSGTASVKGDHTKIGTNSQSDFSYSMAAAIYNYGEDSILEITGGTFYSTGSVSDMGTIQNIEGEVTIGGASVVVSCSNSNSNGTEKTVCDVAGTSLITGGTFSGKTVITSDNAKITISDGAFAGELVNVNGEGILAVSGGLFSDADVRNYLAKGVEVIKNTDTATKDAYPWKVQPPEPVAKIDWGGDTGIKEYYSVELAVSACIGDEESPAEEPTTITLIRDTAESVTIPAGKNIVLDLNGKVLSAGDSPEALAVIHDYHPNSSFAIRNRGKLAIVDQSTEKTGKIIAAVSDRIHQAAIVNDAVLSVSGCGIESGAATSDSYGILNSGTAVISGKDTFIKVDGGSASSCGILCNYYANGKELSVTTITDATISVTGNGIGGSIGVWVLEGNPDSYLSIDGTHTNIQASNEKISASLCIYCNYTISDGTFCGEYGLVLAGTGTITGGKYSGEIMINEGGSLAVSGGLFSDKNVKKYCADGYESVPNTNAKTKDLYAWKVKPESVAQINWGGETGIKEYHTVAEAIEACPNDAETAAEITLIADQEENVSIPEGKNILLDLNGHVLQGDGTQSVVTNAGTLTITDRDASAETHQVHYFEYNADGAWKYVGDTEPAGGSIKLAAAIEEIDADTTHVKVKGGVITGGCSAAAMGVSGGGGISNTGTLTMTGGSIIGNRSDQGGGILSLGSTAEAEMKDVNVLGNEASSDGEDNPAAWGGGVSSLGAQLRMEDCTVAYNKSEWFGGGIYLRSTLVLKGSNVISGNTAGSDMSSNLYLHDDGIITIDGELTNTTPIGITRQTSPGVFSSNGTAADVQHFQSDSRMFEVKLIAGQQVEDSVLSKDHLELVPADGYRWYLNHEDGADYLISNIDELEALAEIVNSGTDDFSGKTILLSGSFKNTGMDGKCEKALTTPIGEDFSNGFKGTFDGNGQNVELDISVSGTDASGYAGMFGVAIKAEIRNLSTSGRVKLAVSGSEANSGGGVIGLLTGVSIMTNCSSEAEVSVSGGTEENSAGGLVGELYWSKLCNCYSTGRVSTFGTEGTSYAGGIAGHAGGMIENCYYAGTVSAEECETNRIGGMVGLNEEGGQVLNCYYLLHDDSDNAKDVNVGLDAIGSGDAGIACYALDYAQMKAASGETGESWVDIQVYAAPDGETEANPLPEYATARKVSLSEALGAYVSNIDSLGDEISFWGVMNASVNDGFPVYGWRTSVYLKDGTAYTSEECTSDSEITLPDGITYKDGVYTFNHVNLASIGSKNLVFYGTDATVRLVGTNQIGVMANTAADLQNYAAAMDGIVAYGVDLTITGDKDSELVIYDSEHGIRTRNSAEDGNRITIAADFEGALIIHDSGKQFECCCINATGENDTVQLLGGTVYLNNSHSVGIKASNILISGGTIYAKGGEAAISAGSSLTLTDMTVEGSNEIYEAGTTLELTNKTGTEYVTLTKVKGSTDGMSIIGDDSARYSDVKTYTVTFDGDRPAGTRVIWDITGGTYEYVGGHIGTDSVTIICEEVGELHICATLVDSFGRPVTDEAGEIIQAAMDVTVRAESGNITNMIAKVAKALSQRIPRILERIFSRWFSK